MPNNTKPTFSDSDVLSSMNANNFYKRNQIEKFTKFSRLGYFDPYNTSGVTREYVFFTKPDLHLFQPNTQTLNPELSNIVFFTEAYRNHRATMNQLQWSVRTYNNHNPFCNLLTNTAVSKVDLQDISVESMETAANIAGTKLEYPLGTTTSSNIYEFNIDFEDTKFLDVYMFFRIWYEYELLKGDGAVTPPDESYITNRILHNMMSMYKIIVGEDMETIIHYTKFWGVYPTTIPRAAFTDIEGVIKFGVGFKCQWVEDMDPLILSDFNKVVQEQLSKYSKNIPIYNRDNKEINGEWCHVPYIVKSSQNGRNVFKLKWR